MADNWKDALKHPLIIIIVACVATVGVVFSIVNYYHQNEITALNHQHNIAIQVEKLKNQKQADKLAIISGSENKTPPPKSKQKKTEDPKTIPVISSILKDLKGNSTEDDLKKFFGQIFLVGFSGKGLEGPKRDALKHLIEKYGVGGLIFYERNIVSKKEEFSASNRTEMFIDLVNKAKTISFKKNPIPLFLSIDHEGGNASPLIKQEIATPIPSPMALSAIRSRKAVETAAQIMSAEMKALGLNLNHAPVVDINISGKRNVIMERSFGADQNLVSTLSKTFLDVFKKNNVQSVIKHFPGHGLSESGFASPGLPISEHSIETIRTSLFPFYNVIDDVEFVMTSHLRIKSLECPFAKSESFNQNVSFNKKIISELLRKESHIAFGNSTLKGLGFKKIVVSDNLLEPCATSNRNDCSNNIKNYIERIKKNALHSLDSGHDILILSHIFHNELPKKFFIKKDNCSRWAISLNEFKIIYDYIFDNIFNNPNAELKAKRMMNLKNSLIRIVTAKEKIFKDYQDMSNKDIFFTKKVEDNHLLKTNYPYVSG